MTSIPGILIVMTASNGDALIFGRLIMGIALATFVTCQVWCSQFFDSKIVGVVNATAGGWGNLGGGITILVMPQIMEAFLSMTNSSMSPKDSVSFSWRMCFIIP